MVSTNSKETVWEPGMPVAITLYQGGAPLVLRRTLLRVFKRYIEVATGHVQRNGKPCVYKYGLDGVPLGDEYARNSSKAEPWDEEKHRVPFLRGSTARLAGRLTPAVIEKLSSEKLVSLHKALEQVFGRSIEEEQAQ